MLHSVMLSIESDPRMLTNENERDRWPNVKRTSAH